MFKRIISSTLAALTLLGVVACSNETPIDTTKVEDTTAEEVTTTSAPETEPAEILELPDTTFDNRDFNVFMEGRLDNTPVYKTFYVTDENSGTVLSEATTTRNRTIEEKYGIKLIYHSGINNDDMTKYDNSVRSGSQAYDLCTAIATFANASALKGYLIDLNTLDHVDLEKSWYLPYLNEEFSVKGKMYVAGGYFDMTTFARTSCVFFSTQMVEDNEIEDLYALVKNNEWTYDKMLEIASKVGKDINGDGVMQGAVDQFGLTGGYNMNSMLITTTGYRFTSLDETGTRIPTGVTETLLNFNDLLKRTYKESWYYDHYVYGGQSTLAAVGKPAFTDNRILFLLQDVSMASDFASVMDSYGILPVPKYSADQKDFVAYCRPSCTGIASDVKDVECAQIIYEALNYYSKEILLPAYVDVTLSSRYASSQNATEMLEIIFKNVACDFAQTWYATLDLKPNLHNSCGITEDYASYFASNATVLTRKLAMICDNMGKVGK